MYSGGGNGTSILGNAVGADAGGAYKGAALDFYYTQEKGAVYANGAVVTGSGTALSPYVAQGLKYTISNDQSFGVMGKYTMDVGGGFKDEAPASKLTFFGGYVYVDLTNPDHTESSYEGDQTLNNYALINANNFTPYLSDKILQTGWLGASYETGPWTYTGAWYVENQNNFDSVACATTACTAGKTSGGKTVVATNFGGDLNWVSGVVDYRFDKHFDVYGGVTWTDYSGAWTQKSSTVTYGTNEAVSVATGLRLKF